MSSELDKLTEGEGAPPPSPVKKTLVAQGAQGLPPENMDIPQAPKAFDFGGEPDQDDEDDEDDEGRTDVILDPELIPVLFDEGRFRRQTDASLTMLDMAQKNLKSVFDSGSASDPEIALALYRETIKGAALMIDTARKLVDTQMKQTANKYSTKGAKPKDVTPSKAQEQLPAAPQDARLGTEEPALPADSGATLGNSRFGQL